MIRSFADDTTRDVWHGANSKAARRIPKALWPIVRRKLDQIDAVTSLDDLRVPPGNRLHALEGDRAGRHAIRVNEQYRVVFRFEGQDAYDVSCADYHEGGEPHVANAPSADASGRDASEGVPRATLRIAGRSG